MDVESVFSVDMALIDVKTLSTEQFSSSDDKGVP